MCHLVHRVGKTINHSSSYIIDDEDNTSEKVVPLKWESDHHWSKVTTGQRPEVSREQSSCVTQVLH